jgi:hypothetical protein
MRKILIGLTLMLFAPAASARAAADCDKFQRVYKLLLVEQNDAMHELNRVQAMNPKPTNDVALCRALRLWANDLPYFFIPSPTCFQNPQDGQNLASQMAKMMPAIGTLVGSYCSDDELHRPVKSRMDECIGAGFAASKSCP